jgi:hypothetical protein
MATYSFYLKNAGTDGSNWGEGDRYVVGTEMKTLFDQVCQLDACPFADSDYWWDPATVGNTSLLVYFVDSPDSSLVRQVRPGISLGAGGTTLISSAGNLSEVYLSAVADESASARALAVLAFHEGMHNLLRMGNRLHAVGGMGLAAETVYANSQLTQRNKDLMAPALGATIPQNTSFL